MSCDGPWCSHKCHKGAASRPSARAHGWWVLASTWSHGHIRRRGMALLLSASVNVQWAPCVFGSGHRIPGRKMAGGVCAMTSVQQGLQSPLLDTWTTKMYTISCVLCFDFYLIMYLTWNIIVEPNLRQMEQLRLVFSWSGCCRCCSRAAAVRCLEPHVRHEYGCPLAALASDACEVSPSPCFDSCHSFKRASAHRSCSSCTWSTLPKAAMWWTCSELSNEMRPLYRKSTTLSAHSTHSSSSLSDWK